MANINKNIIMQAGAAVANATNKAAGLSAATPEPGSIISVIQLVNGGRTIGPDALAHFTESVRNKLLSLQVDLEPIQSGSGTPSPDNVRPISGRTGLNVYVSPTQDVSDATTYAEEWTSEAGTVYGGTLDVVTGVLTVDRAIVDLGNISDMIARSGYFQFGKALLQPPMRETIDAKAICSAYPMLSTQDDKTMWQTPGYVRIKDSSFDTVADFKTAVAGQTFCYELATPLTYQLTAQEVVTFVGDNYIWSDSGDVTITE